MPQKYWDIFDDIDAVHTHWNGSRDVTDGEVLLAIYSYEDYSGSAYLLYERDGKLYEVFDSHCSCYGLENWEPEETSWTALANCSKERYGTEFNEAFLNLVKAH
jgi:hypothetical protein